MPLGDPLTGIIGALPAAQIPPREDGGGTIQGLIMHKLGEDDWNQAFNDNLSLIDAYWGYWIEADPDALVNRAFPTDGTIEINRKPIERLEFSWDVVKEDGYIDAAMDEYIENFQWWTGRQQFDSEENDVETDGLPPVPSGWTVGDPIYGLPGADYPDQAYSRFMSFVRPSSDSDDIDWRGTPGFDCLLHDPYVGWYGWPELEYRDNYDGYEIKLCKAPTKGFPTVADLQANLCNDTHHIGYAANLRVGTVAEADYGFEDIQPGILDPETGIYYYNTYSTGFRWMLKSDGWTTENQYFFVPRAYLHDSDEAPDRLTKVVQPDEVTVYERWDKRWSWDSTDYPPVANAYPVIKAERVQLADTTGLTEKTYLYGKPIAPMLKDETQLPNIGYDILRKVKVYLARKLNHFHALVYGAAWKYDQELKTWGNYVDDGESTGLLGGQSDYIQLYDNEDDAEAQLFGNWPTNYDTNLGEVDTNTGVHYKHHPLNYAEGNRIAGATDPVTSLLHRRETDFLVDDNGNPRYPGLPGVMQLGQAFIQYLRTRIDYLGGRQRLNSDQLADETYIIGGKLNRAVGWRKGNASAPENLPSTATDEHETYYQEVTELGDGTDDKWYQFTKAADRFGSTLETNPVWRSLVRAWQRRQDITNIDEDTGLVKDPAAAEPDFTPGNYNWDTGLDLSDSAALIQDPIIKTVANDTDDDINKQLRSPGIYIYARMKYRAFKALLKEIYLDIELPGQEQNYSINDIFDQFVPFFRKLHQLIGAPGKGYPKGWINLDEDSDGYGELMPAAGDDTWSKNIPPYTPSDYVDSVKDLLRQDWHIRSDRLVFDGDKFIDVTHFSSLWTLWRFHTQSVGRVRVGQINWAEKPFPYRLMDGLSDEQLDTVSSPYDFTNLINNSSNILAFKNEMGVLGDAYDNVGSALPVTAHRDRLKPISEDDNGDQGTGGSGPHGVTFDQFKEGVGIRYYEAAEGEDADITEASSETYE